MVRRVGAKPSYPTSGSRDPPDQFPKPQIVAQPFQIRIVLEQRLVFVSQRDGTLEPLPNFAQLKLAADETVVSMCTGGGGYGRPEERDAHRVAKDVSEGWVSRGRAREVYRVALNDDGSIDESATSRLRAASPAP